jgi:ADP-heptose:LPS heptosyltransferase
LKYTPKILIIRFSSIGDIVLTSPVPRCIKNTHPNAEIHFLTKPQYANLLQFNPHISKVHLLDKSPALKALELKKEGYDYVIDLHNNLRTQVFKSLLGAESQAFDKVNFEKWLAVNFKQVSVLPNIHIVDRYANTCETLGVSNDNEGLDFFLNPEENVDKFMSQIAQGFVAWAVGAQHFTKRFPSEKIVAVCKLLQMKIVLLGGKEDKAESDKISDSLSGQVVNLCGSLSIHQSAMMVKEAKVLVSNDTGLMHIGAAFKKPIISLWGNTIPEFGMSPYYGKYEIKHSTFEIQNLSCRPCSKIGFNACPKKHFNCMNQINVAELAQTIQQLFLN